MLDLIQSLPCRPREAEELDRRGFVVLPSPWTPGSFAPLVVAYDDAVANADPADIRVSASVRVHGLAHQGPEFEAVYVWEPLLALAFHALAGPFVLGSLLARTLLPGHPSQRLHADVQRGQRMLGFIVPIDAFDRDNGATRFVPGSHALAMGQDAGQASHPDEVLALAPKGAFIVYHGSVWHGYTVNRSQTPRRSIQGAFALRDDRDCISEPRRPAEATRAGISALARYLLGEGPLSSLKCSSARAGTDASTGLAAPPAR